MVVNVAADPTAADGSAAYPFAQITDGVLSGAACVVVLPGEYSEILEIDRDLELLGFGGSAHTLIDGEQAACDVLSSCAPVIDVIGPAAVRIEGFTLTGGGGHVDISSATVNCDAGVCSETAVTVCGGGLDTWGAQVTLGDVIIVDNDYGWVNALRRGRATERRRRRRSNHVGAIYRDECAKVDCRRWLTPGRGGNGGRMADPAGCPVPASRAAAQIPRAYAIS